SATLPARIIRSAQESFRPYFCLIGHSSRRALSRFALSGHELSGAETLLAGAGAAAAVGDAVGARAVPRPADHQSANFMSTAVCPSLSPSTEITRLKGSSVHRRLCLADDVC